MSATCIRYFFIALLLASAIGKLTDMQGFYEIVKTYQLLPEAIIPITSWMLVGIEVCLGLWLAVGRQLNTAALALILLHLVYLDWLMIALLRKLEIPNCGCFGVHWPRPLTWLTPLEDIVLILLAITLWRKTQ